MQKQANGKCERVLGIYSKLMKGDIVSKKREMARYGVNERTLERDIRDIRKYLDNKFAEGGKRKCIIYDHSKRGYRLEELYQNGLTNGEILEICKILLSSRSLPKEAMESILTRLIRASVPKVNQGEVQDLIKNELFHYIAPRHGRNVSEMFWQLGQAVRSHKYIIVSYKKSGATETVERKLKPAALLFSEYYFYLAAFIEDEELTKDFDKSHGYFPAIYRLDRIERLQITEEKFRMPYTSRFEDGEFKKRVQFMFGGKLRRVKFKYLAGDLDAVLDRLPTAEVISEENGVPIISAEVYGDGIDMWLRSQGDWVEVIDGGQ